MPSPDTLRLFALASVALVAVPGPAVLYIVSGGILIGLGAFAALSEGPPEEG